MKNSLDWLDSVSLKDWLEKIADLKKQESELERLSSNVRLIPSDSNVHVHKGIDDMAEAAGVDLSMDVKDDSEYMFEYSFVYKGIRFFQLEKERLAGYENV